MSVEPIGLLTLAIGLATLFAGAEMAMLCFVPMTLLGSAGAILLGGAGTIQPAHLMLGFLALSIFVRPQGLVRFLDSTTFPREGFWLTVVVSYGILSALLLPRVFAGMTNVNAIGSTDYGPSLLLVPLGPTSGNITQSIYLTADLICFMAVLVYASIPRGHAVVVKALLAFCGANVVFAFLDVVTSATGTGDLLGFIRNAEYQLHVEEVTGGLRRIVGSFTETSSFAYATIGALGFSARFWLAGRWTRLTGTLSVLSLGLLIFSTSSTAYAATPGLLAVLYGGAVLRVIRRGGVSPAISAFIVLAPVTLIFIAIAVSLNQAAFNTLHDFLTVTLFDKSTSQSGLERAQWNQTALENFFDTLGVGGGLGSIRASSFPIAVLSNLGIAGVLGFAGFFGSVLFSNRDTGSDALSADVRSAARVACAGLLIAATVSGALVDLGLTFYIFAAMACAVPRTAQAGALAGSHRSVMVPAQG